MPHTTEGSIGRSARKLAVQRAMGLILVSMATVMDAGATAAQEGAGDWQTHPSDVQCVPQCRSGFECRQGECTPVCTPPCGPGLLCTSGGMCVRTEPDEVRAPVQSRVWSAPNDQCVPLCRSGYTCLSGQCVSACNPICPANQTCTPAGQCVPGAPANPSEPEAEPAAGPAAAAPRSPKQDSIVNLHIDVLGALQFGLAPALEIGKKVSGYLRLRSFNTGVASYFVLERRHDDELRWGLGAALGLHVFSGRDGNMRGLFGGPNLEYAFVRTRNVKRDQVDYGTHALIPQLDFGNRWAFDGFLLGLGAQVGLWIPLNTVSTPLAASGCNARDTCDWNQKLRFVAGVFLDLGWYL
ncbi:MAG: hypothetical protein JWN48_4289 [Myxococcaceae bacterium]|nr:hypothetical protein [Myxococcaceae bacterium]